MKIVIEIPERLTEILLRDAIAVDDCPTYLVGNQRLVYRMFTLLGATTEERRVAAGVDKS